MCEKSCAGDSLQLCGGESADIVEVYVATCPPNQKRFGDFCYKELSWNQNIQSNADSCTDEVGRDLYYSHSAFHCFLPT